LFIGPVEVDESWKVPTKTAKRVLQAPPGLQGTFEKTMKMNRYGIFEDEGEEDEMVDENLECTKCGGSDLHGCRNPPGAAKMKPEKYKIQAVTGGKKKEEWAELGLGDITVDSAAERVLLAERPGRSL
jgi:hypothetical protein